MSDTPAIEEFLIKVGDYVRLDNSRIADPHTVGRVVQIDTPEGLILNPADAYVAEFTRKIPRHRVLRAGSLARPAPPQTEGTPVPATALVADIAARVLSSDRPVPVADERGAIIGAVDRDRVIAAICGTDAA